jgi:3-hydroxyacyl-CoA dehydrogenase/3-hydroxy-2-methylbutyryl-CoA dehydrogenase
VDINGKVAVITGGASGIGQAVARALAAKGAKIGIFDLNEAAGQAMVDELGAANCVFAKVNVADEDSTKAGIAAVINAFGAIHINMNCAGIANAYKTLGKDGAHPLDGWKKVIDVNLTGTFNVLRLCAEQMAKNEPVNEDGSRGVIINTASVAAFEGQIGQAAYSATKGAIVAMSLPIARDLANVGIRVNSIAPGLIHTPMFDSLNPEVVKTLSQQPLYPKRLGKPQEIAKVAISIIENDYINGECIRMDAGIRMQPK